MKKTVMGRVPVYKEPAADRFAALHIPARLLCLALAVVIWLAVTNLVSPKEPEKDTPQTEVTEAAV